MEETIHILTTFLKTNFLLFSLFIAVGSMLLVFLTIPRIIYIAHLKKLTAPIVARSSHSKRIPSLGGVSFYITLIIFISLIEMLYKESIGYNIIAALSILFMVGLKDDLINTSAKVKLYGQTLATLFIAFSPSFHISNLHGFMGIYEIDPLISSVLTLLFLIFFINAFNLVDGIDGLATSIGIVICVTFSVLFFLKQDYSFMLLTISTSSILVAFLRYNLSNGKLKIFMGDCGSLIIGMLIGLNTLHYLSLPFPKNSFNLILPENNILILTSILFVPVFDTLRIIIIRIINGKSPFEADRNHLHHVLTDTGLTHFKSSIILAGLNVFIILAFGFIAMYFNYLIVFTFMVFIYLMITVLFYQLKKKSTIFESLEELNLKID